MTAERACLSTLELPEVIRTWLETTFPAGTAGRATTDAALAFWQGQGWPE